MSREYIYLGHDNTNDLILKADGSAQDLSTVTKITATFNDDTYIESEDNENGLIKWAVSGYDTGEIRLDLGGQSITPGDHDNVPIVVYDPSNTDGILWGYYDFTVVKDPEGSV